MERHLEDDIREAIEDLYGPPREPAPPRRITISVEADLYAKVEQFAKRTGQSWSAAASLLLGQAVPYALQAVADIGLKVTSIGLKPDIAKELLLNPHMADEDPGRYQEAQNMRRLGMLVPEVPPEDPDLVEEYWAALFKGASQ